MQEFFMREALEEAKKAYNKLEIPVGAGIVKNGEIIARAHNIKEEKKDTTNASRLDLRNWIMEIIEKNEWNI